eukprot:scaffold25184_cov62-Phaeocystis_antarctica.AAC.8
MRNMVWREGQDGGKEGRKTRECARAVAAAKVPRCRVLAVCGAGAAEGDSLPSGGSTSGIR